MAEERGVTTRPSSTSAQHQLFHQMKDRRSNNNNNPMQQSNYSNDLKSSVGPTSSVLPGLDAAQKEQHAQKRKRENGSDQLI